MTINEKIRKKLRSHFLFSGADEARTLPILEKYGSVCIFGNGDEIMAPSGTEKKMGVILSGKAAATTSDPQRSVRLRHLSKDDLFGVANLFTSLPFVSNIRAEGKCTVLFLPEDAVRELLSADASVLSAYLRFLSERICLLNRKIGYLTAGSAERRLALLLLSYRTETVELGDSVSSLSELLDVGRASLYRAFDRLEADGLIERDRRCIRIPDPSALEKAYL